MPTSDGVLSKRAYDRLLGDVGGLIERGRSEAENLAGHILAATYWNVGRRVLKEEATERAGYREGVLRDLSHDLAVSLRTLQHAVRFARMYEEAPKPGLHWTHYRELIAVADDEAREFYEARALEGGWTKTKLLTAIRRDAHGRGQSPDTDLRLPRPTDGNYVYRCSVDKVVDGDTLVVSVDLGFDVKRVQRLRLVNVSAPSLRTDAGRAAERFVREQLARAQTVVAKTARHGDAHGRYVAHVFYSGAAESAAECFGDGTYLNGQLLREGHVELSLDPRS